MNDRIQGRLTLTVSSRQGVIARRQAHNLVLRKGAGIIAKLFAGVPGGLPINQIQVGFGKEAATAELTALTPPADAIPVASLRSPLTPADFQIATDKPGSIRVSVTAVFKPVVNLPDVTEAGCSPARSSTTRWCSNRLPCRRARISHSSGRSISRSASEPAPRT